MFNIDVGTLPKRIPFTLAQYWKMQSVNLPTGVCYWWEHEQPGNGVFDI